MNEPIEQNENASDKKKKIAPRLRRVINLFWRPSISDIFSGLISSKKSKKTEPVQSPKLCFQKFTITDFKGIDSVHLDLARSSLVLLLGLNESGKTTILKGIESFNFLNDPMPDFDDSTIDHNFEFFKKIRKKSEVHYTGSASVTAEISIEQELQELPSSFLSGRTLSEQEVETVNGFIHHINSSKRLTIRRVFPFKEGKPKPYRYEIVDDHPFTDSHLAPLFAHEIVAICPFVIYFEDFKDRIPDKIFVNKKNSDSYDPTWYDIIDGLFYNTDPSYNIDRYRGFYSSGSEMPDDAATVLTKVNKTLNETFTKKWQHLSGVKDIETTRLDFTHHGRAPHFTLRVVDTDSTTYSIDERSKGALWYLSFLMKTEFRSKKMRKSSGMPVFLIDEPASNLHSTAQENMINDFKTLADDTSVIYTTHSQYLVSTENIRNTYIIKKKVGVVSADKWGEYLKTADAKVSYYQPLANLLNIIPNTFDIPWRQCVLTEGPSDRHVLLSMCRILHGKAMTVPIYPGTSANGLGTLISLNIGWNAQFRILLDSDEEGKRAADKYKKQFAINEEIVLLPEEVGKIEKSFSKEEMGHIRSIVLENKDSERVTKKEFAAIWGIVAENKNHDKDILKILTRVTIERLEGLLSELDIV
jgi:AAA ATPase domain